MWRLGRSERTPKRLILLDERARRTGALYPRLGKKTTIPAGTRARIGPVAVSTVSQFIRVLQGKKMRARRVAVLIVAFGCSLLFPPATAWAQSGAIAGVVKDTTGAVLPGVSVEAASPALIEKVRTGITDAEGQYRIEDLRAGTYSVTFTLAGFSVVKREGLELSAGVTMPVNGELRVGSLEETLTVTGASPVVDVQNVRTQSVLTRQVLDSIPIARNNQSLAQLTVGVYQTSGPQNDVGGVKGENYAGLATHGGADGMTFMDGMRTTTATNFVTNSRVSVQPVLGAGGGARHRRRGGGKHFGRRERQHRAQRRWQPVFGHRPRRVRRIEHAVRQLDRRAESPRAGEPVEAPPRVRPRNRRGRSRRKGQALVLHGAPEVGRAV